MNKELTEQWKNGTLEEGWYYLSIVPSKKCIDYYYGKDFERYNEWAITKVLAPVPTYDEWVKEGIWYTEKSHNELKKENSELVTKCHRLEKQLAIATKALRDYADESSWVDCKTIDDDFEYIERKCAWYIDGYETAQKALKEIEDSSEKCDKSHFFPSKNVKGQEMTKEPTISKIKTTTLTGKWKNGTLEDGYYYVKNKHFLGGETEYYHVFPNGVKYWGGCDDEDIEEVFAPVPDYNQVVELTEKVDELTTKCSQLKKKVKKRGMQIERAYDRYVAKRKENSKMVTKCNHLEKQLDIAVKALEEIERKSDKFDNSLGFIEQLDCIKADCQETLYYLKKINEVSK